MTGRHRFSEYEPVLGAAADRLYRARRAFLREEFDGYVADTHYVEDVGYFCWPAVTDGAFDGYEELAPAERPVVADLEERGFDLLGVGVSRVAFALPDADYVAKIGRCGMNDDYGDGRRSNLVEAQVSRNGRDLPIVPCRYATPRGEFAIYPRAVTIADVERVPGGERRLREIRDRFAEAYPFLDGDELTTLDNVGRWNGEARTFDYAHPADVTEPYGVPDHVDADAVIAAVDERRRRGRKRDLTNGGGYVDAVDSEP